MKETHLAAITLGVIILLASSGAGAIALGSALVVAGAAGLAINCFQSPCSEENNTPKPSF